MKPEMILVEFVETVYLPRFVIQIGDTWRCRLNKQTNEGFSIGGGFAKKSQYKIIG